MNVSIIIATYGEDHWAELAESRARPSAAAQTDNVWTYHSPDGTIASARNEAAQYVAESSTGGDWLCFLDADDELAPGYLDAMKWTRTRLIYEDAWEQPCLLTPAVQQVRKGRPSPPTFYPEVDLLKANWLVVGTLLRRDLFERVGGFEDYPHGFEDYSLWNKCARMGARVVKVPKAVYIQHVNPQSKHRIGWRDRKWQVATHERVNRELDAWTP